MHPAHANLEPLLELKNFLSSLFSEWEICTTVLCVEWRLQSSRYYLHGVKQVVSWLQILHMHGSLLNNTFLNILDDFSLEQLVLSPTHENHILDLVLTSLPGLFTNVTIVPGMLDHKAVTFRLNVAVRRLTIQGKTQNLSFP